MASSSAAAALCVALMLVYILGAHAVPPALPQQASASSCSTELIRLLPCLPFVDSAVAAPSDTCCANLGSMVHDEPACLCQALGQSGSGAASPVPVNISRVMQLPRLCRLDLPAAAGACAGLLPVGPAPASPASVPRPSTNSTTPSVPAPVTPTPPLTTTSPRTSSQLPEYSSGSKLIVHCTTVALGLMAMVSAPAF